MDSSLKFATLQDWTSVISHHFIVNILQYYHSFRSKMYTLQTRVLLFVIIQHHSICQRWCLNEVVRVNVLLACFRSELLRADFLEWCKETFTCLLYNLNADGCCSIIKLRPAAGVNFLIPLQLLTSKLMAVGEHCFFTPLQKNLPSRCACFRLFQ